MKIDTLFNVGDYVIITLFDLNYHARINKIWFEISDGRTSYSVCYSHEGEIKFGDFYEDELRAMP